MACDGQPTPHGDPPERSDPMHQSLETALATRHLYPQLLLLPLVLLAHRSSPPLGADPTAKSGSLRMDEGTARAAFFLRNFESSMSSSAGPCLIALTKFPKLARKMKNWSSSLSPSHVKFARRSFSTSAIPNHCKNDR